MRTSGDHSHPPVLVLMPGLDGTGILFADFVKAIESEADCQVMAYPNSEPLGYGELEALIIRSLPEGRPFVLLAESFSGPLALRIAGREPDGLVGLIMCVTFARNPYPLLGWARPLAAHLPVKSLPRWLRAPLMWGSGSPQRATSQTERAMSQVSVAVIRRRIAELLAADETATLKRIRTPTLVIRATRDHVISKRATLEISRGIAGASLAEVDGPHLLLKTRPNECATIIKTFLRSVHP